MTGNCTAYLKYAMTQLEEKAGGHKVADSSMFHCNTFLKPGVYNELIMGMYVGMRYIYFCHNFHN